VRDNTLVSEELREIAFRNSATIFGVGRVDHMLDRFPLLSRTLRSGMKNAISIGIRLSDKILDDIEDRPTQLYYFHYRRINQTLDHIGIGMTNFIQSKGFSAIPVPASQTIDLVNQRGILSHKAIGQQAGHGWIGRNNLLVHPIYGASLRYTTVLTDIPIVTDELYRGDCGGCRKCLKACPAGAISDLPENFDRMACLAKLKEFSKMNNIRHHICGICVRECRRNVAGSKLEVWPSK